MLYSAVVHIDLVLSCIGRHALVAWKRSNTWFMIMLLSVSATAFCSPTVPQPFFDGV